MSPWYYAAGGVAAFGALTWLGANWLELAGNHGLSTRLRVWAIPAFLLAAPLLAIAVVLSDVDLVFKIAQLIASTALFVVCLVAVRVGEREHKRQNKNGDK